MNDFPKYVLTAAGTHADWANTTIITGADPVDAIRDLTQQPGKDIAVSGSPTVVRWLLDNDLLDELRLFVVPLVLGSGKRLFPGGSGTVPLSTVPLVHLQQRRSRRHLPEGTVMTTIHPSEVTSFDTDTDAAAREERVTRALLTAGLIAGPVYVATNLTQALSRRGFVIYRHAWSTLANGDLGWIQRTNLLVTGLLLVVAAVGLHRVLHIGRGSRWAPRGLALFGAGMAVASFFPADPALGFPPGTPADYRGLTGLGIGHMMAASTGFVGAMICCFALGRRFRAASEHGWAIASFAVGAFFITSFVGLSGTGSEPGVVAFTVGVIAVFAWILAIAARYRRHVGPGAPGANRPIPF